MMKSSSKPTQSPAEENGETLTRPEWIGFFREAKRLAALARSRREAAAQEKVGETDESGAVPSEGQNNG